MRVLVTAKVRAVTPNLSSLHKLLVFLKAFRDWTQYVINNIWNLDHIPSMKELHYKFYKVLRKQGFRAHHCHKIERRAREVVKATKKNNGSKPILRKLTARLDNQDYRLDLNSMTLRIVVLNNEWVELKLVWYSYLNRYLNSEWKLKEMLISYRDNTVWVYLTFEKQVELKKPRTVMGVDINFNNVTYTIIDFNGRLITMGTIPFRGLKRALHFKKLAENLQKKYPRSWRFIKWVKRIRARWLRRARNILSDSCHFIARRIVEIAKEYDAVIVLEDLKKLKTNANGNSGFYWELQLWTYRRIQSYISYKALQEGIPIVHINPRKTSRTSPIGGKLKFINYKWVRLPNEYIVTRDIIASWNLALKYLHTCG